MSRRIYFSVLGILVWSAISCLSLCAQVSDPPPDESIPAPKSDIVAPATSSPLQVSPLAMALGLYRSGKLEAAAEGYKSILHDDPRSAPAYVGLARVYLKQKRVAEASTAAAKAVEMAPRMSSGHVAMGEVYFRQAKIEEAEKEFLGEVKRGTREARAYLGLARIYSAMSLYEQAKKVIDRAYELDPKDPDIRKGWMETLGLAEKIKALSDYLRDETNDDKEERANLERWLKILEDRAKQPNRSCRLQNKVDSTSMNLVPLMYSPYRTTGSGLVVKLNGASALLLLDTGASGILVDRKVAEKAGIKRVAEAEISGIGDKASMSGYVGFADSIRIGELEFRGCYVEVADKKFENGDDGLIGADVFSQYLVDIEFLDGKLKLNTLPERPGQPGQQPESDSEKGEAPRFLDQYVSPEMKAYTPILHIGHNLLIPTRVNDSAPVLFLIDSGGFDDVISPTFANNLTNVEGDAHTIVKGLNGSVNKVYRADSVKLQFSRFLHERQRLVSFDTSQLSNDSGIEISGILGFAMLRLLELKIDYRDGLVDFKFDPNRWH